MNLFKIYAITYNEDALTVIRKIEQGKTNLNLEKVIQVLKMFGHTLVPISKKELNKHSDKTS